MTWVTSPGIKLSASHGWDCLTEKVQRTLKAFWKLQNVPWILAVTIVKPDISFSKACRIEQSHPKQQLGEPCGVGPLCCGLGGS